MNFSATFMHKCNRFFLHARKRSYSPGVEGYGFDSDQEVLVLFPHDVLRNQAYAPIWCRTAAGGLPSYICCTSEILIIMVAFANWPLLLAVGRTITKIQRLIGSSCLSRTTNWFLGNVGIASKNWGDLVAA